MAVGPQSVDKREWYQQPVLPDLKSGCCPENKTKVNADIKVASKFVWWKEISLVDLKQEINHKSAHWEDVFSKHAEDTEVSLFIVCMLYKIMIKT